MMRQALDVVKRTNDRMILRERPQYSAGWALTVFGVALAAAAVQQGMDHVGTTAIAAIASFCLLRSGLRRLVLSIVSFDRKSGVLRVQRLVGIHTEKHYAAQRIEQVFERKRLKGNTLAIQLTGGRSKNLSLFAYRSLSEQAAALNHLIHTSRKYVAAHAGFHRQKQ